MTTDKDIQDELDALTAEIADLVGKKAKHQSHLHETDEARTTGRPGMHFCPGCRLKVVTARLAEMASARDDDKVPDHKAQRGESSRRDEVIAHLKERREAEKVKP